MEKIKFSVSNNSNVPNTLGEFANFADVRKFMENIVGLSTPTVATRYLHDYEIDNLRKDYQNILENMLPEFERQYKKSLEIFQAAKKDLAEKEEANKYAINQAKALASEVKMGTAEYNAEAEVTYRVAAYNKYFYFTYINGEFLLCRSENIPENEKTQLYNAMNVNEKFFDDNFPNN